MFKITQKWITRSACALMLLNITPSHAAQGEMGIGVPEFAVYGAAVGAHTRVLSLASSTVPFPQGCTSIALYSSTMGAESYKIALAMMMTAKATGKRIRFFAHAPRDDGCGVDYVQLQD